MSRELDIIDRYEFQFTRNMFRNRNLPTYREFVYPYWKNKGPLIYLELGVYKGQSLIWMLQHILGHPDSRAIGIDPWLMTTKRTSDDMEIVRQHAFWNIQKWDFFTDSVLGFKKCQLLRANSAEVLPMMNRKGGAFGISKNTLDICLIDADHNALAVLNDARLVFPLMKIGGWIIFDDVVNDIPKKDHVENGLRMFLEEIGDSTKLVIKHRYVEIYERIK